MIRWLIALLGLALATFAIVALTGPGRIDIEDGQARFEAGRNWLLLGRPIITDPRVYWHVMPGRGGENYSYYRFPSEAVAAFAVAIADATGPATEGWRHFIFTLNGAVTAALLAIAFAIAFRQQGLSHRAALGWAVAGIFCTPCWYYATSTFDDLLGTLVVLSAITLARAARSGNLAALLGAMLLIVLAVNCKPPLAAFVLTCIAIADNLAFSRRARWSRAAILALAVPLGHLSQTAYHTWKFPPEVQAAYDAAQLEKSFQMFFGNVPEALIDFAVGPSAGAIWYFPPIIIALAGLIAALKTSQRNLAIATAVAAMAFTLFIALLTFYKGDVCWGPRYLTPVFAVLWLFAPLGAARFSRGLVTCLLIAGALVQCLGLAMVPQRLYLERELPSSFFLVKQWLYLRPEIGHLPNRPREIVDALTAPPAPEFTPAPSPTFALPVFDSKFYNGPPGLAGIHQYTVLNTLRPWWVSFPHLPAEQRPVNIAKTVAIFAGVGAFGLLLLALGLRTAITRAESTETMSHAGSTP